MTSTPIYRYLRGYALNPGFSTRLDTAEINEVVYRIPFESVEPGPMGEYIDVVDFDPATGCWYNPVDLRAEDVASQQGLAPSEGSPQFHQQFVYCVAMKTIRHFEEALGRKIIWYPRWSGVAGDPTTFVRRLRIHPHAIRDANAYYDPDKRALLFGYFDAANETVGTNLPGGLVFTCLSPDIVAHETTHAILDAIHHRYMEDTNPDVAGFHEGFADIVALLQRFTFRALVENQLYNSSGRLDVYTVLGELAAQFGEALEGHRGALRGMIGRWNDATSRWEPLAPSPADYVANTEAHDRGAVLVATIFDAFQRIYAFRTRDLFRIASNGTGVLPQGQINRDLVARLATEAQDVAQHLLHVCIRALDYCPPVDITYGDYLRALITADVDIAPEDETGYRVALIEAFRARGMLPHRVKTLSVESLRWSKPNFTAAQQESLSFLANALKPDIARLVETRDREELFERSLAAQAKLHELITGNSPTHGGDEWEQFLGTLGLTSLPAGKMFGAKGKDLRFITGKTKPDQFVPPIYVHTVRPAFRSGREGRQIEQVMITLEQQLTVNIGTEKHPNPMVFRGGCSLIVGLGSLATAEYVVAKSIRSLRRLRAQIAYATGESDPSLSLSMYAEGRERKLNFRLLHR